MLRFRDTFGDVIKYNCNNLIESIVKLCLTLDTQLEYTVKFILQSYVTGIQLSKQYCLRLAKYVVF